MNHLSQFNVGLPYLWRLYIIHKASEKILFSTWFYVSLVIIHIWKTFAWQLNIEELLVEPLMLTTSTIHSLAFVLNVLLESLYNAGESWHCSTPQHINSRNNYNGYAMVKLHNNCINESKIIIPSQIAIDMTNGECLGQDPMENHP